MSAQGYYNNWAPSGHTIHPSRAHGRPFAVSNGLPEMPSYHSTGKGVGFGSHQPNGAGGTVQDQLDLLRGFFGAPQPGTQSKATELMQENEFLDYPSTFTLGWGSADGRFNENGFMSEVMIAKVTATMAWPIYRMAPMTKHDGPLNFSWEMTTFSLHLLDKLPEQSVPRNLTFNRTGGSASMERYGICMVLEATFAETPFGRYTYLMNLEQMRMAIVETASFGAVVKMLTHTPYADPMPASAGVFHSSGGMNLEQVSAMFEEDIRWFGIAHKELGGIRLARSHMKMVLARRNGEHSNGNLEILPQGMDAYIQNESERKYFIDGPGTDDEIGDWSRPLVVFSREFSQGHGEPTYDPFFSPTTIGAFATMHDGFLEGQPEEEYKTAHLDILLYVIAKDDWVRMSYADHATMAGVWKFDEENAPITQAQRYDTSGGPGIGVGFFRDLRCHTWAQVYRECRRDGTQKLLNGLERLPAHLRPEFLSTLRLLRPDDKRVRHVPGRDKWDEKEFLDTDDINPLSDDEIGRLPSASDLMQAREAEENGYVGLYGKSASADDERRALQATLRKKRAREDALEQQAEGTPFQARLQPTRFKPLTVPPEQAREELDAKEDKIKASPLFKPVFEFPTLLELVRAEKAFTFRERAVILDEIYRVMEGQRHGQPQGEAPNSPAYRAFGQKVVSTVPLYLAQTLAGLEQSAALKTISTEHLLPFERDVLERERDPSKKREPLTSEERKLGRWAIDGTDEDGQLALAIGYSPDATLPLPNDVYAATLAERHTAFFSILTSESTDALAKKLLDKKAFSASTRQRTDAAVWSFLHSLVFRELSSEVDKDKHLLDTSRTLQKAVLQATNKVLQSLLYKAPPPSRPSSASGGAAAPAQPISSLNDGADVMKERLFRLVTQMAKLSLDKIRARALPSQFHMQSLMVLIHRNLVELGNSIFPAEKQIAIPEPDANTKKQIEVCGEEVSNRWKAFHESKDAVAEALEERIFRPAAPQVANLRQAIQGLSLHNQAQGLDEEDTSMSASSGEEDEEMGGLTSGTLEPTPATGWTREYLEDLLERASVTCGLPYIFFCLHDLVVPFYERLWFPNRTFDMAPMVRMMAGANGAMVTRYQKPHMMVAANVGQKMIIGNLSLYLTSIVLRPNLIVILNNVFCRGILGGCDTTVNDPCDVEHVNNWTLGNGSCGSMFVTLGPMYKAVPSTWWLSFSGVMPEKVPVTAEVAKQIRYEGSDAIRAHWSLRPDTKNYGPPRKVGSSATVQQQDQDMNEYGFYNQGYHVRSNTICFQDHERHYSPTTKSFSEHVHSKGHWGPRAAYKGAANVMAGRERVFKIPDHLGIKMVEVM